MKNNYFLISLLILIASCNTKKTENKTSKIDSTIATAESDTAAVKESGHYLWASDFYKKKFIMTKMRPLPQDSLTAVRIIEIMNTEYPEIQIQFDKKSNDTLFLKIPNSTYLTQQTGSSGPEIYFAKLTYNFTELNNVKYVDVRFKKGDHAASSTYSRTDFQN